jgi:nucleolar protein 56
MTDKDVTAEGWFVGHSRGEAATAAVREGRADSPADWPALAVEAGFAADKENYYDALHEATVEATQAAAREAGRAHDQQLKHAIRAVDDTPRVA